MKDTNCNSDTLLSYWFFFTYRSSYFAVSLQTLVPNLYTFLSLSYSFLLMAGWCCPIPMHVSHNNVKVKTFVCIARNFVLLWLGKTQVIWRPTPSFAGSGTEVFNTHKTRIAPRKPAQTESPFKVRLSSDNFFNLHSVNTRVLSDILHR